MTVDLDPIKAALAGEQTVDAESILDWLGALVAEVERLRASLPAQMNPMQRAHAMLRVGRRTYWIDGDARSITCHLCGLISRHAQDVLHRFCGRCGLFHEDLLEMLPAVIAEARRVPREGEGA